MKEYIALATCILPEGMLDWFNLKDVRGHLQKTETISKALNGGKPSANPVS